MKKYITLIILLTLTIMSNAQNKERPEPILISDILSYAQFQEIKQFVLDQGQTQTYYQMYNDNPYYEFRDGNNDRIKLYLNPVFQFPKEEDRTNPNQYNEITLFVNFTSEGLSSYDYIDLSENKESKEVYLMSHWETKEGLQREEKQLDKFVKYILKEIEVNKN